MGQVHFENFDFLVKVKSPLGQSIFSFPLSYLIFFFFFFFFFFFCRRFGPGPVSRSVRVKPGRPGKTGQTVVGYDVMHDVMALKLVSALGACSASSA